ncbi:MAG: transketolase [Bacilli bacterium]|nr:transketolase [Bacilli bacterium]
MKLIKNNDTPINDSKIINQLRSLGIDMIHEAKGGHPGIVLGAAPIMYTLYAKHLKFDPKDPNFFNRDRFIMSSGHGSALLYATLFMSGFDIELEDLKEFRKLGSKTPGHPELNTNCGIDMTTGPLGQGLATAVGMAIAEAKLEEQYNKIQKDLINFNTYVLCGDGDLQEGISYEACSLAGTLKLNRLIVLYDSNDNSLDSNNKMSFNENIEMRFNSMGWNYIKVSDGEDSEAISKAISEAKKSDKPTLIEVKTTIGKFSSYEGTNKAHGARLTTEDVTNIKEKLKLRDIAFNVTNDTIEDFQYMIQERNCDLISNFEEKFSQLTQEEQEELNSIINHDYPIDSKTIHYEKPDDNMESLRETSSKVLNSLAKNNSYIFGGSADLSSSTMTYIEDGGDISAKDYSGKNLFFGVREHAMGAIINGISLIGYRAYASTFLAFSDYMKPSIRMSALLNLPVAYIFTHDSISIGEDGATHQPVEQLVSLRATPNLEVFRPCDANEVIGVYKAMMKKIEGPSVITLSKTKLPILDTTSASGVEKGGYVVKEESRKLDGIIIATGEEVHQAIEVSKRLNTKGIDVRVVSMPCIKRFLEQDPTYIDEVLPVGIKKIVVEAASSLSWNRLIYNPKYLITLDTFGDSGSKDELYTKYGFDVDSLEEKIENLLK